MASGQKTLLTDDQTLTTDNRQPATATGNRLLTTDKSQYIRRENISDAMLKKFRERYSSSKRAGDEAYSRNPPIIRQLRRSTGSIGGSLEKSDIFYYVYGILHCPSYRERFSSDLKKQLPRIPFAADFWTFSKAGRELAALHLNYETGTMYPLKEVWTSDRRDYSVTTMGMKFPSKTEKGRIIFNSWLILEGVPESAYRYVVNGRSAVEWVMERYKITTHKDSGIMNDPNDWCKEQDDPQYIVNLIKRVVYLSVESVKIIESLPEWEA